MIVTNYSRLFSWLGVVFMVLLVMLCSSCVGNRTRCRSIAVTIPYADTEKHCRIPVLQLENFSSTPTRFRQSLLVEAKVTGGPRLVSGRADTILELSVDETLGPKEQLQVYLTAERSKYSTNLVVFGFQTQKAGSAEK